MPTAWPPTEDAVLALDRDRESDLVEFKREWPNLRDGNSKGGWVRDLLALANSALPDEPGWIIYCIEDRRHGGNIIGVADPCPSDDELAHIVSGYTQPVIDVRRERVKVKRKPVDVVGVFRSAYHPHWSTREVTSYLRSNTIYVRHGATVCVATMPEQENFFREKTARIDTRPTPEPIQAGVIDVSSDSGQRRILVRVTNLSVEPVSGIGVMLDARLPLYPEVLYRRRTRWDYTLPPGETIEETFTITSRDFWNRGGGAELPHSSVMSRVMDVVLRTTFRDREGLIRQMEQHLSLADY